MSKEIQNILVRERVKMEDSGEFTNNPRKYTLIEDLIEIFNYDT